MAKDTAPWICDVCGQKKQISNHWFLASINLGEESYLKLKAWKEADADVEGIKHICGLDCLAKWTVKEASKIGGNPTA